MKVIFLNTWNGKILGGIENFLKEQCRDTDIFCLQEVSDEMRVICERLLPHYKEVSAYKFVSKNDDFPQATYVNKNCEVLSSEMILKNQAHLGLGLYTEIKFKNSTIHICNFHGLAQPGDKLDNPDRLEQCQGLIDFFKDKDGLKIIGGDFNILPKTKSIRMFAKNGYRDLIKDFKIQTTRNRLVWERYLGEKQYYSDYVFVSPDIKVDDFFVPYIEISDHLPLILDIKL